MKKLISLAGVLGFALSVGTGVAFAQTGGATGADTAHTAPYWPREDHNSIYFADPTSTRNESTPRMRSKSRSYDYR